MTSTNTAHIRHRAHDDHGGPHGDGEPNQPVRQGGQPKQGPGQNHRKRKERRQLAKQAEERADHEKDGGHQPPDGQQGAGRQGTGGQEGGHESDCECGRRPAGRLEE